MRERPLGWVPGLALLRHYVPWEASSGIRSRKKRVPRLRCPRLASRPGPRAPIRRRRARNPDGQWAACTGARP